MLSRLFRSKALVALVVPVLAVGFTFAGGPDCHKATEKAGKGAKVTFEPVKGGVGLFAVLVIAQLSQRLLCKHTGYFLRGFKLLRCQRQGQNLGGVHHQGNKTNFDYSVHVGKFSIYWLMQHCRLITDTEYIKAFLQIYDSRVTETNKQLPRNLDFSAVGRPQPEVVWRSGITILLQFDEFIIKQGGDGLRFGCRVLRERLIKR